MEKQFEFKLGGIYLDKDETIFTASIFENNFYNIKWFDDNGNIQSNRYTVRDVEDFIKDGKWIILKENANKTFTVKYYNKALNEYREESFDKKKDALKFIEIAKNLIEIKDIKLFKTKEIPLND